MPVLTHNALAQASSSYLRSAMHQPIQWHEWGDEAFEKAKRENKPILLDIGAVWCHWCHVMDRESYEDPETAKLINERFIAIKVDRDERPDIDSRYQVAVQAISGQGGWPLTGFLMPDGRPFYGGTYFPPHDMQGRPSFRRVLLTISDAFREKNGDVSEQAQMVEGAIAHAESLTGKTGDFSAEVIQQIVESALKMFDESNGGFGSAPKFPHPSILDLQIDQYVRSGAAQSRQMAEGGRLHRDNTGGHSAEELLKVFTTTLEKMARGGVYDQLGGGFHRYSVDERWIVPHFEKMSYDNSELLKNYVHAYQATGEKFFADVARDIIRWVDEVLSNREHGGFYASQDADISLDDDGDYFTWTLDEAKSVLHDDEFQVARLHYDINEIGEMQHDPMRNVLHQGASIEDIEARLKLGPERIRELLQSAKKKMYAARLQRQTPYIDKTIYANWNALFVSAYLKAAIALDLDQAKHFALRSLDRLLAEAWKPESGLKHVIAYSDSKAGRKIEGFLDDYAYTANACLDAYESTAVLTYFREARQITDTMIAKFYDEVSGGFLDSKSDPDAAGVLATPRKPFQDSPTPAGNPMAAIALLRMHGYTGENAYREKAERTLGLLAGVAGQYGLFAGTYGIATAYAVYPHSQVVIVGEDDTAALLYAEAASSALIGRSAIKLKFSHAVSQNLPPSLAATVPDLPAIKAEKTTALVCSGFSCKPPVGTPEQLRQLLYTDSSAA
ncbi:MAG TPA: thioredoxin domain-containing protein [Terriglobales bacterium]|nr:thioredoxin domain-containing protein [Terriglobales bacterium]